MKKLFKPFIFTGIGLLSLILFLQLFSLSLRRSKAAIEKVNISYNPTTVTVDPGQNFNIGVTLQAENAKKISAVDLTFSFNDNVSYNSYQILPESYFDEVVKAEVTNAAGTNYLRLVLVAKKPESELASSVVVNLSLKAGDQIGQAIFGLESTISQVVGPTEGNYFDLNLTNGPVGIGIGEPPPTITITPPLTVTPSGTGSANLNLKLRFQGVTVKPADNLNSIIAVIKVVGNGVEATANSVTFTADDNTVWTNSAPIVFDKNIPSGDNYTIYIKGEKHLQKKICDNTPTESSGGSYHCTTGHISLISGNNSLDFSGIILLSGDLPQQDGVVNSYDVTLVRNNLGKTDVDTLNSADINKDSIVNTQDYSLIIYALSTKLDEE